MGKLFDPGAEWILKKAFKDWDPAASGLKIKLFTNDIDLDSADSFLLSDFTIASGGGYADIAVTASDITVSTISGIVTAAIAEKTFNFTGVLDGNAVVRGAILVDNDASPIVIAGDKATASWAPNSSGGAYAVRITIPLSKGMPT